MEEKKKKSKGLIITIVLLILIILGLGGYIVYDKVLKEEPKEEVKQVEETEKEPVKEEEPDFYDISELVKNEYIIKIDTTDDRYIRISNNKVEFKSLVDDSFKETNGIEEKPKYVSAMGLCSDCQGLAYIVLTEENNVYYAENNPSNEEVITFKKVNTEEIVNIYKTQYYQQNKYYGETSNGDLLTVSNETMSVNNTFEKDFPYVDFIYRQNSGAGIAMKLDKDKKIYTHDDIEIKYNNNSISVEEVFAIPPKYTDEEPIVTYYIFSKDKHIYTVDSKKTIANLYSEKQVSSYAREYNETKEIYELKIVYSDGSNETILETEATSTMYMRANKRE